MGIYVFRKSVLVDLLKNKFPKSNDFGGEIIPAAASDHKVMGYLFNDYWEDIGTIKSFFEANLALAQQVSHGSGTCSHALWLMPAHGMQQGCPPGASLCADAVRVVGRTAEPTRCSRSGKMAPHGHHYRGGCHCVLGVHV